MKTISFGYDAFISYSKYDEAKVDRLANRLIKDGVSIWFDKWMIQGGDDIFAKIEDGLENSRTLILCLSSKSLLSDWVLLERNSRLFRDPINRERRLVPVLIDDCQSDIPDTIKRYRYIDLRRMTKKNYQELLNVFILNGN